MPSQESSPDPDDITNLLIAWNDGDEGALEQLMPKVYGYLRGMAANHLRLERPDHTLQTDALVNEAFLRLVRQDRTRHQDRVHFFAIAARMMRRILVDHARAKASGKRSAEEVSLEPGLVDSLGSQRPAELLALDDALADLERENSELAEVVVLHYFGGLTSEEIALAMKMGSATVKRRLRLARAWLKTALEAERAMSESVAGPRE